MFRCVFSARRLSGVVGDFARVAMKREWSTAGVGVLIRNKYTDTSKFKGGKGGFKRSQLAGEQTAPATEEGESDGEQGSSEFVDLDDTDYDSVANSAMHVTKRILNEQHVLLIQPYVKWAPHKTAAQPDLQLQEAVALVHSLPKWNVEMSLKVPVESLDRKQLFGSGKLEELKSMLQETRASGKLITCVFISKGMLTFGQKQLLEREFRLPVMDRYSVVIQILRLHAVSMEAKLQVALAEIPYIWTQVKEQDSVPGAKGRVFLSDFQRQMLRQREKKLRQELATIRSHRELLRNKRRQKNYPIVAVVGYTNAGKTSLIKALSGEQTLQPRNQLFATLDVTAHAGLLPCNLEVLYMDTVGFMSDIPTGLIECFVATLEDAMLADVIVHVQDMSHENYAEQRSHVESTLRTLMGGKLDMDNVINVGNKMDLVPNHDELPSQLRFVSSKTLHGVNDLLLVIERKILQVTGRQRMIIRVPMGGQELPWLYKNAAVTETAADPDNSERMLVSVVISEAKLQQFRHIFVKSKR